MKKALIRVALLLVIPLPLIIMMGYGSSTKAKKHSDLIKQLNAAIKQNTNLQMQGILEQDSLDKIKNISADKAFMGRLKEVKNNVVKQENELVSLRAKAMMHQ